MVAIFNLRMLMCEKNSSISKMKIHFDIVPRRKPAIRKSNTNIDNTAGAAIKDAYNRLTRIKQ